MTREAVARAGGRPGGRTGPDLPRLHLGDNAYWIFFGVYAAVSVLWILLATVTLIDPGLLKLQDMHHGTESWIHEEDLLLSFGTVLLGIFLVWLAPQNRTARWFGVGLVGTAAGFSLTAHHLLEALPGGAMDRISMTPANVLHLTFHLIAGIAYTGALILFPDGKPPTVSTATLLTVWTLIVATLLLLIAPGREPALFILYCGVMGIGVGYLTQWYKARYAADDLDQQRSEIFRRAFSRALMIASGLAVLSVAAWWLLPHEAVPAGTSFETTVIFGALPPLLAAIGVVVVVGILQYRLWGVESVPGGQRLFHVVVGLVMASYVVAELAVDSITENFGVRFGFAALTAPMAAVLVLLLLDRPREIVIDTCNKLLYGTRVRPDTAMAALRRELVNSDAVEAVAPALAVALRAIGVDAGRLTVSTPGPGGEQGTDLVMRWPPGTDVTTEALPLVQGGTYAGEICVRTTSGMTLAPAERQLVTLVACEAAAEVRRRLAGPSPASRPAPGGGAAVEEPASSEEGTGS